MGRPPSQWPSGMAPPRVRHLLLEPAAPGRAGSRSESTRRVPISSGTCTASYTFHPDSTHNCKRRRLIAFPSARIRLRAGSTLTLDAPGSKRLAT